MNILEEIQNCPVEWKELGEVCEIETGKLNANESVEDGKYPFFTTAKEISRINSFRWNTEALLIAGNANVGDVKYYSGKFEAYQRTYVLTNFSHNVKARFLLHIIKQGLKSYLENNTNKAAMSYIVISTLKSFPIPIPPIEIQEKIVQILDKFTDYVTELTSELTSRKKQYSFYRDKLLSFEDEVYQVEWKTLGELFVFKNGLNKGKEFFGSGTPIVNYTDVYKNKKISSDILKGKVRVSTEEIGRYGIQKGDVFFTRTSETQDEIGKTSVLLDEVKDGVFSGFVLRARPITKLLLPEYCAYCFESTTFRRDIVRYSTYTTRALTNGSTLSKLKIPVPSLEIQSRIVQVLDNFDTVCHDLNIGLPKEIELRQKQYEYFREKLLTFFAEGEYTESRVEEWDNSAIIKLLQWVFGPIRVKLGAVVNLQRGKRLVRQQLATTGSFPVYQNSLTPLGYYTESNRVKNTSFVICAGAAGEIGYSAMDFWAADDVYTLETSDNISDKFMYYVLVSKQDRLKSQVRKASIPRLSKDAIDKITFYLPSITEQERIVSTLDNFNTLTNSLSEGLPKEIELRQKQYKYWREQLLNFTR